MISTSNLSLNFSGRKLFEDVNLKFTPGNCYGLIGANGAGKSTFLRILSGDIDASTGDVVIEKNKRLAVLKQDHFAYDEEEVLNTVIMGYDILYTIMKEKNDIYAKAEFTEEDGLRAAELEGEFAELDGWDAESDAAMMLTGLGLEPSLHNKKMKELSDGEKVKVLLAQALFGNPDILLLDEPTNHLDIKAKNWLEEFLITFNSTVIVVSHDRHFLNKVCTHIADIDFKKIKLFVGNYDFWYETSQLMQQMIKNKNKKLEQKKQELKDFISRFSANASKSKQATSRKKSLEKLDFEDMPVSSRKYPFIDFKPERGTGNNILKVENLCKTIDGEKVLNNISFTLAPENKVVFLGRNNIAKTTLFQILAGEIEADSGTVTWGITTSKEHFPKDNSKFFNGSSLSLIDWLRQYSDDESENFIRGYLGRMLFSGDDATKKSSVLSGGEKVRCMLSKIMVQNPNIILLDSPTDHLDLESITSLNKGLTKFPGIILLISHDHELMQTVANRVIEITPQGVLDRTSSFDDYIESEKVQEKLEEMYK